MSGHYDELIGGALDEFRHAEALEGIPAGGSAAVRAKAARRRRARVTTYGVLGALLIAIPVTAFAANPRGNNGPPIAQRFGDGRFRAGELVDAPAPAFDDPACGRQIAGQISNGDRKVYVKEVAHANLDSDPEPETAALLVCMLGNESTRVAAYDRGPDGKPVSLGAVVGRLGENDVVGIRPRAAGGITATVHLSTHIPELGAPEPQDRDFAWDGSKFVRWAGRRRLCGPRPSFR